MWHLNRRRCGHSMKKILFSMLIFLIGCGSEFEPKLTGWTATIDILKPIIYLNIDGRSKKLELPGHDSIGYHAAQWAKSQDCLLLIQSLKANNCFNYQIISVDTSGIVIDTIFTAPPKTEIDFKLAPNDSLLILKTCDWNCGNWSKDHNFNHRFTFYNRFSKKALLDTIKVGNALNISLNETIWSPSSKKVIISERLGQTEKAFIYDLVTKDTAFVDTGNHFIWSPADNDLVAYIKNYSIYTKNLRTREKEIIYKGSKKKTVTDFRWSPNGDFLMINISGYYLNIESKALWKPTHVYLSMSDKRESKTFYNNERLDTWR